MRTVIATPTAGGTVTAAYAQTLVAATSALTDHGADYRLLTIDGADVATARNLLAHSFLSDPSATHILFIDSDMAIDAAVFARLLKLDAPIVGAAYAERGIDLGALHSAMAEERNLPRARALASNFTIRMAPGEATVRDGFVEVASFGFGCVLIRRAVFGALVDRALVEPFVSSRLKRLGIEGTVWSFFGEIALDDGGRLSEDFSFCRRVRSLGDVPLLAYVGPGVGHVGQFTYGGPFIERLKAGPT
ncbi:MAG: hypothetical protein AAGF90_14100 [Pseudomonadota bacterium]